jgi:hypothetical protein
VLWAAISRVGFENGTVHTDEVFFRDTANGFLVWAVGLVMTVTFLVSAAATILRMWPRGHPNPANEGIGFPIVTNL